MKRWLLFSLFIAILIFAFLSGCSSQVPTEIRLGASVPLTGMFSSFGEGGVFGLQAAVDDINKQGGVLVKKYGKKLPVKIIILDGESIPEKMGSMAEQLAVKEKVHLFVSPADPPTANSPISDVSDKYKIPHIIGTTPFESWNDIRLQSAGKWGYTWSAGFRIIAPLPKDDFRNKPGYTIKDSWFVILDMFADKTNKKAGVFASDEPDGKGWYSLFPGILGEYGLTVIGGAEKLGLFPVDTTDYAPMVKKWKEAGVEILWGNCPAPHFKALWQTCKNLGFNPKIVTVGRAPLYYQDIKILGGDLPQGIGTEVFWNNEYPKEYFPGIGDTTPQSLGVKWMNETGEPVNPSMGPGYAAVQIAINAIERAGSLDPEELNKAIGETDMMSINGRVLFIKEEHFSPVPLFVAQWIKTDKPFVWELKIIYSQHDFLKTSQQPIFPVPAI